MQTVKGRCYICDMFNEYTKGPIEEHHCFGGPNRHLSENYGLKVYLCIQHHREGRDAVHKNRHMRIIIQEHAQRAFEQKHPGESFREIFGKNYIQEETHAIFKCHKQRRNNKKIHN